ncbi:hypothetical protein ES319_A13G174000v1 [Gossypium barbadense]|uniref:Pentacotripeptide-repeat region of PRORP domain-containing protein n=2 Tax=Gossypium TaxID=3633 RepID=A0A5J5T0Y2_GOSBA|nr:hypothetical protein ES319_A13G174000v1 [Gossypium barbadense]TYG87102.1 hypothetical protein ES288_A13G186100v1 [Gossypium darwinii]
MVHRFSTRLLNVCIGSLFKAHKLEKAESVIINGIRLGVLPDVVTYNISIDAYCCFGIDAGYAILHRMREADVTLDIISYNSLIASTTRNHQIDRSFDLFDEMIQRGIAPDVWSYNILMHDLFKLGKPDLANRIFKDIIIAEYSPSIATFNIMMNGLCKNGYTNNAFMLFRNLQHHGFVPELLTYNILVSGLCKIGRLRKKKFEERIELLLEMKSKRYTFVGFAYCTVIGALIKIGKAKQVTEFMVDMTEIGIELDIVSYNTLINFYCKTGESEKAYKLLDEIEKKGLECDKYTHTIMIDGLCRAGNIKGAAQHLKYMNMMGFDSNLVAYNCLVDGLCKVVQIDDKIKVYKSMEVRDSFTYSFLVYSLCRDKRYHFVAKLLLSCLRSGMKILKSAQRAVLLGLRYSGFPGEAKRLKSKIRIARILNR